MEPGDDELMGEELRGVESELRGTYARRKPEPGFTERVMERVRVEGGRASEPIRKRPARHPLVWRWAVAGAMVASLAVGVYIQQDRNRRAGIEDERAAEELMLALQLAGQKINKARDVALRHGAGEVGP